MKKIIPNNKEHTLFLGHGYVSQFFCAHISHLKMDLSASIHTTKGQYFPTNAAIKTINFSEIDTKTLDSYDHFVISIPPFYALKTDIVIEKFHDYFLNRNTPYTLIYLSATSVYGNHDGKKVQENSELRSNTMKGMARIACEKKYNALKHNDVANIIILRLAAIYGNHRNNILAILDKKVTSNNPSPRLIARTHVLDISNIIKQILLSKNLQNITLNIADNNPCPSIEVHHYICDNLLKIARLPVNHDVTKLKNSSVALDHKVIDNSLLKEMLDYEFIFPSYREGLNHIFHDLFNDPLP